MSGTPCGTAFGTGVERRSERRQNDAQGNDAQTRPDQTTSNLRPWVVVRGNSCIASNGDLRAPSCNAEAIEHLNFAPGCDAERITEAPCDRAAAFHVGFVWCCTESEPGDHVLACADCLSAFLSDRDGLECSHCGQEWPTVAAAIKRIEPLR